MITLKYKYQVHAKVNNLQESAGTTTVTENHTSNAFFKPTDESRIPVYLPPTTLAQVKKEFEIKDEAMDSFIVSLVEKAIQERNIEQQSSKAFTEAEVKELEEDLRGLGYI